MNKFELLGFIAYYREDYDNKYAHDFLYSLLDYSKIHLPHRFRNKLPGIVKLFFSSDKRAFNIYKILRELEVDHDEIGIFLKDNDLHDFVTKKVFGLDDDAIINILPEQIKDALKNQKMIKSLNESDLEKIFKLFNFDFKEKNKEIKEIYIFLNTLHQIFSIDSIEKSDPKRNIEIKTRITKFAEKYNYDGKGIEYLMYILMEDFHNAVKGFEYFLEDQKVVNFKPKVFKHLIKTIIKEDRNLNKNAFNKHIKNWFENDIYVDKRSQEIVNAFQIVRWHGFNTSTDLILSDLSVFQKKKELISKKCLDEKYLMKEIDKIKTHVFMFNNINSLTPQYIEKFSYLAS